jgi:hypothetical protein
VIKADELREAIAECQGERNPNANTCVKLAAYYSILDHMEPDAKGLSFSPMRKAEYSYDAEPPGADHDQQVIEWDSDSEFAREVSGMPVTEIMPIMDELMQTVGVLYPRLYDGVMRKIREQN